MNFNKNTLLAFILFLLTGIAGAQSRTELEDQAYGFLNSKDYANAYNAFDKLHARYPKEILYQFNLGVCCLNYVAKKDRAIEIFKDMKEKYKTLEVEVYLGIAYHRNYRFDEAITTLTPLIDLLTNSKKKEDKELVAEVKLTIMNSENGKMLIENKVIADIENIGAPVNSAETEGVPIITADESVLIFTYVGEKSLGGKMNPSMKEDPNGIYLSDIYMSKKDATGTAWLPPEPMSTLNTKGNDAAIALSPDGSTLFTFFSNNQNEGDIQVSKLNGSTFSTPVSLNANINTPDYWEGSCSISADGRYLYFASERPGGLGGRDLYVSEKVNGDWGPAINLGPKINTEYDDDAPFIHPDGITLFFSSKGHTSIGGYDIMFCIKEGNEWTKPSSMGIPLNTVEDDSYYVINSKGDKGFFSSTRNAKGSLGEQDIYMVTPGILGEKPIVALLKGTVYGNDKPIEAVIDVVKIAKQEALGPYYSNNESGKYLMALSPGFIYRITVKAEGFASVEEDFDIENLGAYIEKTKDFYLYPPSLNTETVAPVNTETLVATPVETISTASSTETPTIAAIENKEPIGDVKTEEPILKELEKKNEEKIASKKPESAPCNESLPDLQMLKGLSLNDAANYSQLLALMGNYCANNIKFTVQIGAYKQPENYKYSKLKDLGEVKSENYPDGITRFTQKEFTTLKAAEKHRQKTISRGQKDAWIVAFIDGKRYTLEDLIMVDFLGKPIN